MVSFVLMTTSVVGLIAFLIHSVLKRRRYNKLFTDLGVRDDLPSLTTFFMDVPGTLYVAMFSLLIVLLIVKEISIERKSITIRINAVMLIGLAGLWSAWVMAMPVALSRMHEEAE